MQDLITRLLMELGEDPSREGLVEALEANLGDARAASTKFQIQLGLDPYPSPSYRVLYLGRGGLDADKLYIDPETCIDCDACVPECPVEAIYSDAALPEQEDRPEGRILAVLAAEEDQLLEKMVDRALPSLLRSHEIGSRVGV